MPLYEYSCSNCQTKFELLRPVSRLDDPADCPQCHQKGAKHVLSVFACFSKSADGNTQAVAGSAPSCSGCSSTGCSTCGLG